MNTRLYFMARGAATLASYEVRRIARVTITAAALRVVLLCNRHKDELLSTFLHRLADGQELTTQQAADLLNVSRQYLIRLLDANELPFTRTGGKHRRLRIEDVLSYKAKRDHEREEGLDELAALTQDLGGYPELK